VSQATANELSPQVVTELQALFDAARPGPVDMAE
jgi:hypothetical protein